MAVDREPSARTPLARPERRPLAASPGRRNAAGRHDQTNPRTRQTLGFRWWTDLGLIGLRGQSGN